jgi:hypothetical protein
LKGAQVRPAKDARSTAFTMTPASELSAKGYQAMFRLDGFCVVAGHNQDLLTEGEELKYN